MDHGSDRSENVLAVTNEADYFQENAPYITTNIWLTSTDLKSTFDVVTKQIVLLVSY